MRIHKRPWLGPMIAIVLLGPLSGPGCASLEEEEIAERNGALTTIGNCPDFDVWQVCGCDGANFTGTCVIFTPQTKFYADLSRFSVPAVQFMNDKISSLALGAFAVTKFCQHTGWEGTCATVAGNRTSLTTLASLPSDLDNQITSIRVTSVADNPFAPGWGRVTVFEEPNYLGDWVILDAGSYTHPTRNPTSGSTGGAFGLRNDRISSVAAGGLRGTSVTGVQLYEHPDFTGISYTTYGNVPALPSSINDRTSSIKVFLGQIVP